MRNGRTAKKFSISMFLTLGFLIAMGGGVSATEYLFEVEDYSTPTSAWVSGTPTMCSSTDGKWCLSSQMPGASGGLVLHEHIYENSPVLTTTVPVPDGDYNLYVGGMIWDPSGTYDNWDCRSIKIKKQGESSYTSYGYPNDGSGVIDLGIVTVTGGSYTIYVDDDSGSCDVGYYDYVKLVPETGLVAEYHFDGNAQDSSGNGNDGTNYGATFVGGISGQALSFDNGAKVTAPDTESLSVTGPLTLEAWIYPTDFGVYPTHINPQIVRKYVATDGRRGYSFEICNHPDCYGELEFTIVDEFENGNGLHSASIIPLNQWTHVVAVWDGFEQRLYINGVFDASNPTTIAAIRDNTEPLYIGYYDSRTYFKGNIDEVRIYSRALSDTEVKEHYDSLAPPAPEKDYKIVFVPVNWDGSLDSFYEEVDNQANSFISASGIDEKFNVQILTVPINYEVPWPLCSGGVFPSHSTFLKSIYLFAVFNGFIGDRYVGLTNTDYPCSQGYTYFTVVTALVEVTSKELDNYNTAHEIGHNLFTLCDLYDESVWNSQNTKIRWTPFDGYSGCPDESYPGNLACIMNSEGLGTEYHPYDKIRVDEVIKKEAEDPEVYLITLLVYENGTVIVDSIIEESDVLLESHSGLNYSLELLSTTDELLYNVSFSPIFLLLSDPPREVGVVPVDIIVPKFPDTAIVDIKQENETILTFTLEPNTTINIDPDTLNLKSNGKWVTAYIELSPGFKVEDINISSILLNDTISAELSPTEIGDYDNDTIPDLMVKFNRSDVQNLLSPADEVELTVTGELTDGTLFEGTDAIRVIEKGKKK